MRAPRSQGGPMNIAEAKEQIKDTVDGYLTLDDAGAYEIPAHMQRPLFMLGAPGIGKTAIVGQVASELGIGLVSYSMTHHTRQSALGLPFIVHRTYGDAEFDVSEYTMSEIIASVYDYMEETGHTRGILFLDEINCVSETLYPSMLQFLQFKTFGRHQVPEGWIVVCAGNPPEYNKSVFDFDVVTLDRLRKIDVEPDLDAWLKYAMETGVHPAVTSYLQVKENQFYHIETTPSGKAFVTARGWDDLSRIIKLFEKKGKPINRALVEQFIQSDEIAERFAQYYLLFTKYRSDYQIASILEGDASPEIRARATSARLDERLALVRLILDGLDSRLVSVLETEQTISTARYVLRRVKDDIEAGASVSETVGAIAGEMAADAKRRVSLETATDADVRPDRLAVSRLRDYIGACERARATEGQAAFELIRERYQADVASFKADVEASSAALDNAFAFVDGVYGDDREMAAFVAELTARPNTSQFISKFGCDAYYAHNASIASQTSRKSLMERVEQLDFKAAIEAEAEALAAARRACDSCAGC